MKITFITSNPAKLGYLTSYFNYPVESIALELPEIQSTVLHDIVVDKARKAYEIVKGPVLVEDVSLVFNALNTLPGPFIKWFLEALGNEGLCSLLDTKHDRSAVATVEYGFCDKQGVATFSSSLAGTIAESPRGDKSFGWSPIFIPEGSTKTLAEMDDLERREVSMRRKALQELSNFLKDR